MIDRTTTWARRLAPFACTAIVVLSLLPGTYRPHTGASGNFEHVLAYAGTGLLLALGWAVARTWRGPVFLSAAAALLEVAQIWIPGRSAGLDNWAASTFGATLGVVLAAAWVLRRNR
ncbi:VanZ family protein [Siculibacillus lacustris]|uniref:VanZ family protein n=1 Tax=Siculibacillus lacustris TaxID=1549641 RepID=A0A4Q9VMY7_9HYPH|nr:VanZ family protein [Siculibacillus lacustris]TBW37000.1 VanZ family protein [Siculibacillus lacustris]